MTDFYLFLECLTKISLYCGFYFQFLLSTLQ